MVSRASMARSSIAARLGQGNLPVENQVYADLLRECEESKFLPDGRYIHAHILASGKSGTTFLGNLLVRMYGKCGSVEDAVAAFDRIERKNVYSWTIMLGAFAGSGHFVQAMQLYHTMILEGVRPDCVAFASIARVCSALRALHAGKAVHRCAIELGGKSDLILANHLVTMYSRCGQIDKAAAVFDRMKNKNPVSWNAILTAFTLSGHFDRALEIYNEHPLPDKITLILGVKACSMLRFVDRGREIHAKAAEMGLELDLLVANSLISMYGKCYCIDEAKSLFDRLDRKNRDVISWNSIIAAYVLAGMSSQALDLFRESMDLEPNRITFMALVEACSSLGDLDRGRLIHGKIRSSEFAGEPTVENALLLMYAKSGSMDDAMAIFESMQGRRTVSSWNSMIAALASRGDRSSCSWAYRKMILEGLKPDKITFVSLVTICDDERQGKMIFDQIVEAGMDLETEMELATSLVIMYCKFDAIDDATAVFSSMRSRDVIAWTAMVTAMSQDESTSRDAVDYFCWMDLDGLKPDQVAFSSVLGSIARLGLLARGRSIHCDIKGLGLESNVVVTTSLLDMYSKCGSLIDARRAFDDLGSARNVVSWNAMIAATAKHGNWRSGFDLYRSMVLDGMRPNDVTLTNILFLCSHGGDDCDQRRECGVWEACASIVVEFGVRVNADHYCSIVDVLGRSGRLDEAEELVDRRMGFEPGAVEFRTLLGSCTVACDMERGARVAQRVMEMEPQTSMAYSLLAKILENKAS